MDGRQRRDYGPIVFLESETKTLTSFIPRRGDLQLLNSLFPQQTLCQLNEFDRRILSLQQRERPEKFRSEEGFEP